MTIEEILEKLQLHLLPKFTAENIEMQTVCQATDNDLNRLGVVRLGDRIRIRELCKNMVQTPSTSDERMSLFRPTMVSRVRGGGFGRRSHIKKSKVRSRPYTVQFFCLANRFSFRVPDNAEKIIL